MMEQLTIFIFPRTDVVQVILFKHHALILRGSECAKASPACGLHYSQAVSVQDETPTQKWIIHSNSECILWVLLPSYLF